MCIRPHISGNATLRFGGQPQGLATLHRLHKDVHTVVIGSHERDVLSVGRNLVTRTLGVSKKIFHGEGRKSEGGSRTLIEYFHISICFLFLKGKITSKKRMRQAYTAFLYAPTASATAKKALSLHLNIINECSAWQRNTTSCHHQYTHYKPKSSDTYGNGFSLTALRRLRQLGARHRNAQQ